MKRGLDYIINLQDGSFGSGMAKAQKATSVLDGMMGKLAVTAAVAFAAHKVHEFGKESIDTITKLETLDNVLKFASKDSQDYADNNTYITKTIKDMKLPLFETREGFASLQGAMKGSILQGQASRDIFTGVSEAVTVMGLDNQKAGRVFYALNNIMSKGHLAAEELTQQLGDALPGAQKIAAESMGMTTAELLKQMEQGNILAEDFLPRFAKKLHEVYGPGMENATNSMRALRTENNNTIIELQSKFGDLIAPLYIQWLGFQNNLVESGMSVIQFVKDHKDGLEALAFGLTLVAGGLLAVKVGTIAVAAWTGIATIAQELYLGFTMATAEGLGVMAAAQWALNVALGANPIGIIIVAVAALAAGIYYAYNHFEWFRVAVHAVWNVLYNVLMITWDLTKAFFALSTFNFDLMKESLGDIKDRVIGIGDAYSDAVAKMNKAGGVSTPVENSPFKTEAEKKKSTTATALTTGNGAGKSSGTSVSGGQQVRNINVTIQYLVKEINNHITDTRKISTTEMEKVMKNALLRSVHDTEVAL